MRSPHAVTSPALRWADHGVFVKASWRNGLRNKNKEERGKGIADQVKTKS